MRRHLAAKVDVRELSHLEQVGTWSDPARDPVNGSSRRRTWASSLATSTRRCRHRVAPDRRQPPTAFDHREIVLAGRERLRAKLSYTNIGFALAPPAFTIPELRELYAAALGYEVSATNLQRVLLRRELLEDTGEHRAAGPSGGRPATVFRFRSREVDDRSVCGAPAACAYPFGMKWLAADGVPARDARAVRSREAAAASVALAVRADRPARRAVDAAT